MSAYDRKVRDLLVKSGKFDAETANEFLIKALGEGKSLIDYLVETQTLQETEILSLVCRDTKLPPINLDNLRFDKEIVELLPQDAAETYKVLPVSKIGKFLTLAVANPYDLYARDDIRKIIDVEIIPVVTLDRMLERNIRRAYREDEEKLKEFYEELKGSESSGIEQVEDADEEEVDISEVTDEESPVVKLVNVIIANALKQGASDIHVEPFEKRVRLRYRIDGVLYEVMRLPMRVKNAVVSRIKIMSQLDIAERRLPQDGRFMVRMGGREIDFRVSVIPVQYGEKVVMRLLDKTRVNYELGDLGLEEDDVVKLDRAIRKPYGMILVTGPTGSGKSTTLYTILSELNQPSVNICTAEDPIEISLPGVNQVQVHEQIGLTFASCLRAFLRQDPDIIMVGEIRDLETAEIAVRAALTGHLVLSTLHTNDAPSTMTRLLAVSYTHLTLPTN